jgi:hypothetical protein
MVIKIPQNNNLKLSANGEKSPSGPILAVVGKQNEKRFADNRKNCNARVIVIP